MSAPIACTLTPVEMGARQSALFPALTARVLSCGATDDGYRLTFAPSSETLQLIVDVVNAERQCCRWLRLTVIVAPDDGPITLELSGPPGAREFLTSIFEG